MRHISFIPFLLFKTFIKSSPVCCISFHFLYKLQDEAETVLDMILRMESEIWEAALKGKTIRGQSTKSKVSGIMQDFDLNPSSHLDHVTLAKSLKHFKLVFH